MATLLWAVTTQCTQTSIFNLTSSRLKSWPYQWLKAGCTKYETDIVTSQSLAHYSFFFFKQPEKNHPFKTDCLSEQLHVMYVGWTGQTGVRTQVLLLMSVKPLVKVLKWETTINLDCLFLCHRWMMLLLASSTYHILFGLSFICLQGILMLLTIE